MDNNRKKNLIGNAILFLIFILAYIYITTEVNYINSQIEKLGCRAFCECPCAIPFNLNISENNLSYASTIPFNWSPAGAT